MALKGAADAVSGVGGGLGKQGDPEFVKTGAPFGLITMESLAEALPKHRPIRLALASGYTQYGYAFIQQEADRLGEKDITQGQAEGKRAKDFYYLKARGYALDGLELGHRGSKKTLLSGDSTAWKKTLDEMKKEDVPYLYWCAASWALAIGNSINDPQYVGDVKIVDQMMKRALELHEDYDEGAIHAFYLSFPGNPYDKPQGAPKDWSFQQAKQHKDRALALNHGYLLTTLVSYAENILVKEYSGDATVRKSDPNKTPEMIAQEEKEIQAFQRQLHEEFVQILNQVKSTKIDGDEPGWAKNRLANTIAKRRAEWLLSREEELFPEPL